MAARALPYRPRSRNEREHEGERTRFHIVIGDRKECQRTRGEGEAPAAAQESDAPGGEGGQAEEEMELAEKQGEADQAPGGVDRDVASEGCGSGLDIELAQLPAAAIGECRRGEAEPEACRRAEGRPQDDASTRAAAPASRRGSRVSGSNPKEARTI